MKDNAEQLRENEQNRHLCRLSSYTNGGYHCLCKRGKFIYCCFYCVYKKDCKKACLNKPHVCEQHFMVRTNDN